MARMFGKGLAFTTWMSDGLRILDVSRPLALREVGSFVPPAVGDPSPGAGAGPTNRRGEAGSLMRGQSWPTRPLVASVDVIRKGERSGIVVVSDVNAGLYVLAFDVALDGYWSAAADGGVSPSAPPGSTAAWAASGWPPRWWVWRPPRTAPGTGWWRQTGGSSLSATPCARAAQGH